MTRATSGIRSTSGATDAGAKTSMRASGSRILSAFRRHCDMTTSPTQLGPTMRILWVTAPASDIGDDLTHRTHACKSSPICSEARSIYR